MIDCDCLNQNYLCIKTSPVQHNVLNHQFLRPAFSKKGYSSFYFINNFSLFLNICLLLISRQICFSNQLEFSNVSFIITAWFFLKLFIFQGPKLKQSMKTHRHYVINLPGMTNEILWKIETFLGRIQMTHSFSISLSFLFVLQTLFKGKLPKSFHKTTLLMMIIYPVI